MDKTAYKTIEDCWQNGVFVAADTTLYLTEESAKYLRHNLVKVEDEVVANDEVVESEDKTARRKK